jgi:hypothetical protein
MDLSKKKWLYVTGCSHTAGCEVLTPGDGKLTHKGLQKTWSGLLAKDKGWNLINDALPGAGNEYIMNSAIDFVSKWQRDGRDIKDVLVIQAWSTFERQQFAWDDSKFHIHWANGQDHKQYLKQVGHDFENWFKALKLYATDHKLGIKRRYRNIVLCKEYFEANNVDYAMFNACSISNKDWETESLQKKYSPLSRFDHYINQMPKNFFEPYDSFIDRYREQGEDGFTVKEEYKEHISEWLHVDAYLHEVYYNKFKKWLEAV